MPNAELLIPPGIILIATGMILCAVPQWLRKPIVLTLPPLVLFLIWGIPHATVKINWLDYSLTLLEPRPGGLVFASVFILALWLGSMYALQDAGPSELAAAFIYAGSAIGITMCGDWISLFCFWELMALASTVIVWCGKQPDSWYAGLRYLLVHLGGGVLLLCGLSLLAATGQPLTLGPINPGSTAYWLILCGILLNTGAPPFSFWIADAYPQASPSGMVFLSAFTTKTAVFVLLTAFAGESLLIPVGLYMVFYGIVYALLSNDIRQILAYSIVNQVGFMVVAVGIGTPDALNGTCAHAVAHILYKMVLLMGAGAIVRSVGTTQAVMLGGNLWKRMPWTTVCVLVGAAASMGVPFTSSFITKSVVLTSAAQAHMPLVWALLLICSGAVVFNAGGRFPWLALFAPNLSESRNSAHAAASDPQGWARWALVAGAFLCVGLGLLPDVLYAILPYPADYHPYSIGHIFEQIQLLAAAGALFWWSRLLFRPSNSITLDTDWVIRIGLQRLWLNLVAGLGFVYARTTTSLFSSQSRSYMFIFSLHGPHGILARSWHTGSIALWVALMLGSYVIVYIINSMPIIATLRELFLGM